METNQSNQEESGGLNLTRRNFVRSTTAAGIGIGAIGTSKTALGQEASKGKDLHIALIGCGAQGQALLNASKFVDGVKFKAVCDIWQPNLKRVAGQIRGYKMAPEGAPNGLPGMYETAEELFEKEPTIDAVFVAVPDFVHHTYTIMGLDAGKPVYCEKMMSNTIERARQMVQAQRSTGQLLQIGHQRRSNPRYLHARDTLTHDKQLLGWITHAYAQWNRATKSSNPLEWPEKYEIPEDKLREFGFKNMFEFRNWRMFAEYGGGAISDLGAHQIDLFNWFFGATPKSVIASGGVDYHHSYEQFDNVMAIYEYDIPNGTFKTDGVSNGSDTVTSRAYYQVLTTNGSQGFYEKFMGLNGTISINETATFNQVYRDSSAPDWEPYGQEGLVVRDLTGTKNYHKFWQNPKPWGETKEAVNSRWIASNTDARVSKGLETWEIPVALDEPAHAPHVRNFVEVVRDGGSQEDLNCPVEEAFRTCVTVLKVNESIEKGTKIEFSPQDFVA